MFKWQSSTEPPTLSSDRHILGTGSGSSAQGHSYCHRLQRLKSGLQEPQPGEGSKAALMRGQRSFWVKYSAVIYMISTLPGERRDSGAAERVKNAGLIKTNTHFKKQVYRYPFFCVYLFFSEGFTIQRNLEKILKETASSGETQLVLQQTARLGCFN